MTIMSDAKKALDLTEAYVRDVALPNLDLQVPELMPYVALGLVGNGSECFGYDDEISRDHDWGVDFFVWVSSNDAEAIDKLADWKSRLFKDYSPRHLREKSNYGAATSVMSVGDFYRSIIGLEDAPQSIQQWMRIPEESLAMATNGRMLYDAPGEFTRIREQLLRYYPEDLRLKRIATACMLAAQAGQYNFPRMAKRADVVTMRLCLQRFIDQVERLAFLLNRAYRPYYKWTYRALGELSILGKELAEEIKELSLAHLDASAELGVTEERIERVCKLIERELQIQNLSESHDSFIQPHGESVFAKIQDPMLKSLPITYEI